MKVSNYDKLLEAFGQKKVKTKHLKQKADKKKAAKKTRAIKRADADKLDALRKDFTRKIELRAAHHADHIEKFAIDRAHTLISVQHDDEYDHWKGHDDFRKIADP